MPAGPDPTTATRLPRLRARSRTAAAGRCRPSGLARTTVAGVAVAVADGDRLVHLVAAAVLLARGRADAAEDRGERDRPLEDARRLAELALRVRLEEARDVDVAGALVLAGRQAVGVVVAEDQLEVRAAEAADLLGLGLDHHARPRRAREHEMGGCSSPSTSTTHIRQAPKPGQLGLVAERRDLDAVVAADFEDRLADLALDHTPVDFEPDRRRRERALRRLGGDQTLFR